MAYQYYVVYFEEGNKTRKGVNVYEDSEDEAKTIGTVFLNSLYSKNLKPSQVFVSQVSDLEQDFPTTT